MHRGWLGELSISFKTKNGLTWLDRSFASAPLKLQRSLYPEGIECCHNVILHTAGGIVAGDRLSISCQLDNNCSVLITNAAATKVYRSEQNFAVQNIQLVLKENSILEWLPQETILFAAAKFRQNLTIELGENALCFGWEINRFGRTARNEKFRNGIWQNHIEVWQNGDPIWIDRQFLVGQEDIARSYNGLWNQSTTGTFWFIGKVVTPEIIDSLRSLLPTDGDEIFITRLQKGLVCRYRGNSTAVCRQKFILLWHCLREMYTHREAHIPAVWQI